MDKICSKKLLVKAGSKVVALDCQTLDICEYELLQDLEVDVTCEDYFKVEKQGILPAKNATSV